MHVTSGIVRQLALIGVTGALWSTAAIAQSAGAATGMSHGSSEPVAAIVVGAQASVSVAPDRAQVGVGVESRARTAAQASAENARIQTAVIQSLRRQGLTAADLQTRSVQVMPEFEYPREGGRPTLTGYVARNEVNVTLRDLSKVGAVIDAALSSGSTQISGPYFSLANPDSARREALDAAVRKAMADAQVMARAAGVQVGRVLEISQPMAGLPEMGRPQMLMRASADAAPTPVEAGLISIEATVQLRVAIHR
jgi:uncharacterized protein YggE